jgi:hypothetical protein
VIRDGSRLHGLGLGFAVAYFQVPWATKSGGLIVFSVEAAQVISLVALDHPTGLCRLVLAMFSIAVPMTQIKGSYFRVCAIPSIPCLSLNLCTRQTRFAL